MDFDRMTEMQRRLHNAACVLSADGDEHGFEQLQRDAIAEIERLRAAPPTRRGLTDEQVLMIGRRAMDKCLGTEAQHLYIAREVERAHGVDA